MQKGRRASLKASNLSVDGAPAPSGSKKKGYRTRLVGSGQRCRATLRKAGYFPGDVDPALAVNADGDVLVAYQRGSGEGVYFDRWLAGERQPRSETLVASRQARDCVAEKVDYAWATVDPVDDRTFWFMHNVKTSTGDFSSTLVRVSDL